MDDLYFVFAMIVTATLLVLVAVVIHDHWRYILRALLSVFVVPYVIITDLLPLFIMRLPYLLLLLAMLAAVVLVAAGVVGLVVFGLKQLF